MVVLDRSFFGHTVDERLARRALRDQIAKLEADLADCVATAFPTGPVPFAVPATGGPRVLPMGELERVRDTLGTRDRGARALAGPPRPLRGGGRRQEAPRGGLARRRPEPARHKFRRIAAS